MKRGVISNSFLDGVLGGFEYMTKPCDFDEAYTEVIRHSFQIPKEFKIHVPRKRKKISSSGDHWVGIPLEHFRAGLRLPLHRFIHTLLVEMRLGLGQLGPNFIRRICAFIARYVDLGLEHIISLF